MMINRATKEMTVKIVFYGPGLCGKTTNLEYIYEKAVPEKKGKLLTVATETDRTLFFDFLPMELGHIRGMKLRVQLYTVPGQVFYDATRRIVLRGSDGVVFVADSQAAMLEANIESLNNLKKNLQLNSLDPETVPLVLQYNKQDLQGLATNDQLESALNWRKVPSFPSVATVGTGVNETLKKIIELVLRKVHAQEEVLRSAQKQMSNGEMPIPTPAPAPPLQMAPPPAPKPITLPPPPPEPLPEPVPEPAPLPKPKEAPAPEPLPEEPVAVEMAPEEQTEPELMEIPVEMEAVVETETEPRGEPEILSEAVPLEPPRSLATDLDIVRESLEELEKRATAMARDIAELRATVRKMIEEHVR